MSWNPFKWAKKQVKKGWKKFKKFAGKIAAVAIGVGIGLVTGNWQYAVTATMNLFSGSLKGTPKASDTPQGSPVIINDALSPRRLIYGQVRAGGVEMFSTSSGATNANFHQIIYLGEGPIEGIDRYYFENDWLNVNESGVVIGTLKPDGTVKNNAYTKSGAARVFFQFFDGSEDQQAVADLVSAAPTLWTQAHRLRGCAFVYMRLVYDQAVFPNGLPKVSFLMRGRRVYDPRQGSMVYSVNPILHLRDYMTMARLRGGVGVAYSEFDDDEISEQADFMDEIVNGAPRFTSNGIVETDAQNTPQRTMPEMMSAFFGNMSYHGGAYHFVLSQWQEPVMTITEDDLVAGYDLGLTKSGSDIYNAVRGSFIRPSMDYLADEYAPVVDAAAVAADGRQVFEEVNLPWTQDEAVARRIAGQALAMARLEKSVSLEGKMQLYQLAPGDFVDVILASVSPEAVTFRVGGAGLNMSREGALGAGVQLAQVSPAVFGATRTTPLPS